MLPPSSARSVVATVIVRSPSTFSAASDTPKRATAVRIASSPCSGRPLASATRSEARPARTTAIGSWMTAASIR